MKTNKLAIPLMLNSISSTIINLCDQAMVGRTYLEGFASVGIIGSNIYSITGVLGAISIGFNILGSNLSISIALYLEYLNLFSLLYSEYSNIL